MEDQFVLSRDAQKEEKITLLTSICSKWHEDLFVADSALAVWFNGGQNTASIPIDVLRKLASLAEGLSITQKDAVIRQLDELWHKEVERPPKGERKKLTASDIKPLVDSLLQEKRQNAPTSLPNILPGPWSTPALAIVPSASAPPLVPGPPMRNIRLPSLEESLANLSAGLNARDRQASTSNAVPTQLPSHESPFQLAQPSVGSGRPRQTVESPFRSVQPIVGGGSQQAAQAPNQQPPIQSTAQNRAFQAIAPLQQRLQDQAQEIASLRQQLEDVKKDRDEVLAQRIQIQDALDRFLNRTHPSWSPISDSG